MRVLFVGHSDRTTVALVKDLARFRVHVLQVGSRDSAYEFLHMVDAVLIGFPPGLPEAHDLTPCRAIRSRSDIPIIALTGRWELGERILGSRAGADDYVCQPFSAGTLIARIETIRRLRSRRLEPSGVTQIGDVVIDLRSRSVLVADAEVPLSKKEFQILALLAEHGGAVCPTETLFSRVWGDSRFASHATLYVHIATLRSKLGRRRLIETVRGVGYRLAVPVDITSPCG